MAVRLKENVALESIKKFGFAEDPVNCDYGDTYYHLNNYYRQINDFRVTVSTLDKHIDILCLAGETGLHNMYDIKPLYDLFASGLVEFTEK